MSFFFPLIVVFAAVVSVVYTLPSIYHSEATILVEGGNDSENNPATPVANFLEERIQTIRRQILLRSNVMHVINQFNLYLDIKDRTADKALSDKFKENVSLKMVDTDAYDRTSGRKIVATFAFTVSYQGENPEVVKDVTDWLASQYVAADLKERERLVASTAQSFQEELEGLRKKIETYEEKISEFKQAHLEELPEYNKINIQVISELRNELNLIRERIKSLQQQKTRYEADLSTVSPSRELIIDKDNILLNPKDRLKQLRLQLTTLQATLSDKHPDIKKLKRTVNELETEINSPEGSTKRSNMTIPDNPRYLILQVQVKGLEAELKNLRDGRQRISKEIEAYRQNIRNTPLVEKKYAELTRDYESAKHRYEEITDNLLKVRVTMEIDESQGSARFRIFEPAYLPQKADKPNRKSLIILGFFMACVIGFVFAALRESMDISIKSKNELYNLTDIPVLAVIPVVEHRKSSLVRKLILFLVTLLFSLAFIWLIHQYITPVDVLWTRHSSNMIER